MAKSNLSPLHRQIAHVSRRLFMQTLLACLLWCWAGSLVIIAGWFLLQPHVFASLAPAWRLGVAGGIFGAGTLLALVMGMLRAPSRVAAALLLDERFALEERKPRVTVGGTPLFIEKITGQRNAERAHESRSLIVEGSIIREFVSVSATRG